MEPFFPCFGNDGGPLLVLPKEALSYWEGTQPPSNERVVTANSRWEGQEIATDYDRACDLGDTSKLLQVGPSWGIVLGQANFTCDLWLRLANTDTFLLLSIFDSGDCSREDMLDLYAAQIDTRWTRLGSHLQAAQGDFFLLHAASSGLKVDFKPEDAPYTRIGDAMLFAAPPGCYNIDVCEIDDPERAHVLFHRFRMSHA